MPDNQATPLEVALYVRGEFTEGKALTDDEIKRAGISREGTLGSIGYRIGRNAGETVISNMRNGTIDERQALWIADFAPGSDKVQAAGVRLAIEGASKGEIIARMEAEQARLNMQDEMGLSGGTDLFGGALDNDEFDNFAAKYVNRRRNSLGQDISYLNKLVGKKLSKEQAKKYGINIKDPDGLRKALDKLRLEQAEWQNPWVRRELMDEIRDAWEKENPSVDGSGEATAGGKGGSDSTGGTGGAGGASMSVTEVKRGGKEPPVFKMLDLYHKGDLRGAGGASFSVIGKKAKTWDKYADKAFLGRDDEKPRAEIDASQARLKGAWKDIWKNKKEGKRLGEVLDYPELFEAYPVLAGLRVYADSAMAPLAAGGYVKLPLGGEIRLNGDIPYGENSLRSVLLHEVQHVIQDIEGFTRGSNPGTAGDKARRIEAARRELSATRNLLSSLEALPEEAGNIDLSTEDGRKKLEGVKDKLERKLDEIQEEHTRKQREENRDSTEEEDAEEEAILRQVDACDDLLSLASEKGGKNAGEIIDSLKKEIERAQKRLDQVKGVRQDLSDYELYQRTAGEIESRNVQKRRDWTAEQRQATPFNDTLEYPGEAVNFGSFSVTEAKERKLFDEHGVMRASNGILIDGTSFVLTAMHASPHWIKDNFRMDKEGSGEGVQMFGSGMYFTENDRVNDKYLGQFKKELPPGWLVNGKRLNSFESFNKAVPGVSYIKDYLWLDDVVREGLLPAARKRVRGKAGTAKWMEERVAEAKEAEERLVRRYKTKEAARKRPGRGLIAARNDLQLAEEDLKNAREELEDAEKTLAWAEKGNTLEFSDEIIEPAYNYRVEIDAEEGEFFYWDDPLTDESNAGALEKLLNSPVEEVREMAGIVYGYVGDMTGEEFYRDLTDTMRRKHGLSDSRADRAKAQRYASEALLASGIKGHKYADGFTRGKPRDRRKYNCVIWDMDAIKITHIARGNRDWKPREEAGGSVSGVGGASMSVTEVKRGGKEPPVFKMLDLYHKGDLRGGASFSVTEAREKKLFDEHGFMRASNGILFDGTSFVLTAMHASPHWIKDAFRMSKEGSGEGAQVFGSGMYFTESDGVNDHYLGQFKKRDLRHWVVNGKRAGELDLLDYIPGVFYESYGRLLDNVREKGLLEAARIRVNFYREMEETEKELVAKYTNEAENQEEWREFEEIIAKRYKTERTRKKKREERAKELADKRRDAAISLSITREKLRKAEKTLAWAEEGNTLEFRDEIIEPAYNYRVEIDAEENELFYWDDALTDESNKGALEKMLNSPVEEVRGAAEFILSQIEYAREDGIDYTYTGENLYRELTERMLDKYELSGSRADRAKAQRYASEALLASGIKGHKYADGFTRGKPRSKRKYNEVIWDMDAIKITHIARGNRDWKPREEGVGSVGGVGGASMSVIGQRSKTFSKYLDKAFLGRDDGKMRAEIDASQARLKGAWTAPADLDKLATRGERKKLDELRGAWEAFKPIARAKEPEKLTEKQALQAQAAKLGKDLERLADRMLDELGYRFEGKILPGVRDKARRHVLLGDVDWLRNDADTSIYKQDKWKLGEVLDYPELFEAYPELAEMEVRDKYLSKGNYGGYNPLTRTIEINDELPPEERRSTILHEIQHAIQDIEGFAEGSTPAAAGSKARRIEAVRKRLWNASDGLKALEALPEEIKNIDLRTNDGKKKIEDLKSKVNQKYSDLAAERQRKKSEEHRDSSLEEWAEEDALSEQVSAYNALSVASGRGWKNAEQIIDSLKKEIEQMRAQLRGVHGVRQGLSDYELYQRTAGEIESRNVESRRDWTAERRR